MAQYICSKLINSKRAKLGYWPWLRNGRHVRFAVWKLRVRSEAYLLCNLEIACSLHVPIPVILMAAFQPDSWPISFLINMLTALKGSYFLIKVSRP